MVKNSPQLAKNNPQIVKNNPPGVSQVYLCDEWAELDPLQLHLHTTARRETLAAGGWRGNWVSRRAGG